MIPVAIIIGIVLMRHLQPAPLASMVTSTVKLEPGHWLAGMNRVTELQRPSRTAVDISTDGSFIVYSAIGENPGPQAKPQLYLRRTDKAEARPIAGTEAGINPFLSPDGRSVGFWADGKLKKIPVEGGVATDLCEADLIFGANWSSDNRIIFADQETAGISMVSGNGGTRKPITFPDPMQEERSHRLPFWLPSGKAALFTVMKHGHDPQPSTALLRLDTGKTHVLLQTDSGGPQLGVHYLDGKTIAHPMRYPVTHWDIVLLDTQSGQMKPFLNEPFNEMFPEVSPDGRWIAYSSDQTGKYEIYVQDFPGKSRKRKVSNGGGGEPLWARNGKQLFYRWPDQDQVWVVDVRTDSGLEISKPRLLFKQRPYLNNSPMTGYDLSLDGKRFLMVRSEQRKAAPVTELILIQNWSQELKRLDPAGK